MAGYSGTPLPKKLGIKPGHHVLFINAPADFGDLLGELPADVQMANDARVRGARDVIVLFVTSTAELRKRFATLQSKLDQSGGLWIAWPKQASRVPTDLTESVVRAIGLGRGLVDNKVCAIDDLWSGLRFVVRVQDRAKKTR